MDGWESRRKRTPGHDYCVVRLGVPGLVRGLDINTRFFTGNYPPAASVEACVSELENPDDDAGWFELLPKVDLAGDSHNFHAVECDRPVTHLRLHIYPDGGVAQVADLRRDSARIRRLSPPTRASTWRRLAAAAGSSRAATSTTAAGTT